MRLTFLGTGTSQGVPVMACHCEVCRSADERDKRLRTSALLEVENGEQGAARILFDIGPDFRQQMLRSGVERIDAILVTHAHRDHIAGLDDIRPFNYVQHRKIDMYMNEEAATAVKRDYHYIFEPHEYPGLPEVDLHVIGERRAEKGELRLYDTEVVPIRAMHKNLPVLGYRVGELAYVTDANYIAPGETDKIKGVKMLVINALRKKKHFSHFCLEEALEVIKQVGPERAYLTHVSHEMGCHAEVQAELPDGVWLAYDGLMVEI